ncbi:MAG TPA: glucosamine-6-phosphate deaminase [Lacipirellulaceae bacterium]|nr:glucosamine-6-phosphate deaminase [Lacipirellulaceae bacterium]
MFDNIQAADSAAAYRVKSAAYVVLICNERKFMDIKIMPDKAQMGKAAADAGAQHIRRAIDERGAANIIVATGASQFEMLDALVHQPGINWHRVTGFHLDEYVGLPITHPASFRAYLWKRFVSQLPLPLRAFHFLDGEGDAKAECRRVADIIRQHPIDVAFVGIGENGHLAFNDPPANFETEEPYLVVQLDDACRRQQLGEGWFPTFDDVPKQAISMSVRQIMISRAIICTVPDARKADAVRNAVEGGVTPQVPASILQQHLRCTLFLDSPAASLLQKHR